jgi:uncharacterized protein (DUF1015 family)
VAEIHPFRGVRYNQELVEDLAGVICPPYDIIPPQLQQELYHQSPHNFIRIESARGLPQDKATDNKYTRAAAALEHWLEQGVLVVDPAPAVYLHDHYFTYSGRQMVVRPHEGILAEFKEDRLSLLWALHANTSPILTMFEDQGQQVSSLLAAQEQAEPIISFSGANGEGHKVWAITEPEVINRLSGYLAPQPLYIADGHHRYESALTFLRERRAGFSPVLGDEAFNFVMMTLVDFSDPGLLILPPHRLVRGISRASVSQLLTELESFFDIEELPLDMPDVWQQVEYFLVGGEIDEVRLVLFGPAEARLFLLRLRDLAAATQLMPYFHSELYKKLDVSILDHIILEELLGLGSGGEAAILAFTYEGQDAVNRVLEQEYQLTFLLRPVRPEVIKAVADAGDRMPRKSTYFYPKAPAGLVFHQLV